LQSDGGSRCAGISAASVALADAGINMRDLVSACAAGKVAGQVVLDVDDVEDKEGQADLPIAILPNSNQVTLLQLDGQLTDEEFNKAFNLAIEGARKVYQLQREALIGKYFQNREDGGSSSESTT
jgi:exosome complex component RRP41